MRRSGEAVCDYVRSADAAPVRPSDVMGNAKDCPRGDRFAYRLWGIIWTRSTRMPSAMCRMIAAGRTQQTRGCVELVGSRPKGRSVLQVQGHKASFSGCRRRGGGYWCQLGHRVTAKDAPKQMSHKIN